MSLAYGLAAAAASLGLQSILIKPKRHIGAFEAYVTITERHQDDMEIVEHPVEQGAAIADHAFMRPPEVVIECACSNSPIPASGFLGSLNAGITGTQAGVQAILTGNSPEQVKDMYDKLRGIQNTATMVDVVTGKRDYKEMLIRSLTVETDKETEHVLRVTVSLRQIIRVSARIMTIAAPKENQGDPESTLPMSNKGAISLDPRAANFNMSAAIDALTPTRQEIIQ